MKLTKPQLKQLIKEEIEKLFEEDKEYGVPGSSKLGSLFTGKPAHTIVRGAKKHKLKDMCHHRLVKKIVSLQGQLRKAEGANYNKPRTVSRLLTQVVKAAKKSGNCARLTCFVEGIDFRKSNWGKCNYACAADVLRCVKGKKPKNHNCGWKRYWRDCRRG